MRTLSPVVLGATLATAIPIFGDPAVHYRYQHVKNSGEMCTYKPTYEKIVLTNRQERVWLHFENACSNVARVKMIVDALGDDVLTCLSGPESEIEIDDDFKFKPGEFRSLLCSAKRFCQQKNCTYKYRIRTCYIPKDESDCRLPALSAFANELDIELPQGVDQ